MKFKNDFMKNITIIVDQPETYRIPIGNIGLQWVSDVSLRKYPKFFFFLTQ